ncbi:unnamed protein product [Protopolystoma xenopodis]|uniref:Uncharacterized protein n=1 Tax=Protopolystoma xenopodis TaxID=117903 RepID=A0A3S5FCW9_9PLAT|nr:unnamed protein product [Protopolystoma xenopodis]
MYLLFFCKQSWLRQHTIESGVWEVKIQRRALPTTQNANVDLLTSTEVPKARVIYQNDGSFDFSTMPLFIPTMTNEEPTPSNGIDFGVIAQLSPNEENFNTSNGIDNNITGNIEAVEASLRLKDVTFLVGSQSCPNLILSLYCNGHLDEDTEYRFDQNTFNVSPYS